MRTFNPKASGCESPIETTLARAIMLEIDRCNLDCEQRAQEKVGSFRADIFIETRDGRSLAIECDGRPYHAATVEQVDRDKRRDRFFAANGISVMRFSGSEINRCPEACATEVRLWVERSRNSVSVDAELHAIANPAERKAAIMAMFQVRRITAAEADELIFDFGLVNA